MKRAMVRYMEKQNKQDLVGAEIGVNQGGHALLIFEHLDIKHLYLIDCYDKYMQKGKELDSSQGKQVMFKTLEEYEDRYTLFETTSEKAHVLVRDNSLDFVYIDGNHQLSYVADDIRWWSKKVKSGGIVGGHDILGVGVFLPVLAYALFSFNISRLKVSTEDWWIVKR